MYKKILFGTFLPLALISCNQENELKMQEASVPTTNTEEVDYFSNNNNSTTNAPINIQPVQSPTNNPVTAPPAPINSNTSNSNIKLNPEHGQPGHRCDIPVGAPLNAPAGNMQPTTAPSAAPSQSIQVNPTNTPSPAPITAPAPAVQPLNVAPTAAPNGNVKLNPEHGQPGHRCEIPVGSPLPE